MKRSSLVAFLSISIFASDIYADQSAEELTDPTAPLVRPPPSPPKEMERFDFMIGTWECIGTWRQSDGITRRFSVDWQGRRLLNGHAQIEEYRSVWPNGETFVYGLNYRMFDSKNRKWITKWFDVLGGNSFDLGQPVISRDANGSDVIVFSTGEEANQHRATYKNISEERFTWEGDFLSDSGERRDIAAMTIDCSRARE